MVARFRSVILLSLLSLVFTAFPACSGSSVSSSPSTSQATASPSPTGPIGSSPDTSAQQGVGINGIQSAYVSSTAWLAGYDFNWNLKWKNTNALSGLLPGVNHFGDIAYYDGQLIAPAEYYYNCSSFGPTVLAVYNAGNGALTTWSDISADLHEASSVAVVPEKDQVVVSSFCDAYQGFTTLWVYNLNTLLNNPPGGVLTATTTIRMSIPVQFIQGISWNSTIGQFLASTVGGVAGNLWYIAPDGGVTGPAYVVPGTQSAELEGLDFTTDNVYYLENGYVTNIGAPVAAPSFSVSSGTYTSPQTVTISDANAAAAIHYTIDGSMPTAASPVYSAPIPIATTKTLKAIATVSGSVNSPMTVATFTIN